MTIDLEKADCLEEARVIYSMWPGYLERGKLDLRNWCKEQQMDFDIVHTSGHATPIDLGRLVEAIKPKALIPIHTLAPEKFNRLNASIKNIENGIWHAIS